MAAALGCTHSLPVLTCIGREWTRNKLPATSVVDVSIVVLPAATVYVGSSTLSPSDIRSCIRKVRPAMLAVSSTGCVDGDSGLAYDRRAAVGVQFGRCQRIVIQRYAGGKPRS